MSDRFLVTIYCIKGKEPTKVKLYTESGNFRIGDKFTTILHTNGIESHFNNNFIQFIDIERAK